jgi:CheY-like chemotaxis protein
MVSEKNEEFAVLDGARLLIAEDNVIVALDISYSLEDFGATVVGPVSRVADAITVVENETLDGAILDVHLQDGAATAVAEVLMQRAVPIVFCTGGGLPLELEGRVPQEAICTKPIRSHELAQKLGVLILAHRRRTGGQ